jgi:hypothetical protein
MNYESIVPIVRTLMNTFALYLMAHGLIDEGLVDYVVALGVNGLAVAWFVGDKWFKARALKKRRQAEDTLAPGVTSLPTLPEVIKANP